jgi:AcrR family transcriptional regulator
VEPGQPRSRWSGVPLENRLVVRRHHLIAAGVQLLGDASGPALTVRAVCRAAELTERYFYESFRNRDEFVHAVYDDVCTRAMTTLITADSAREAVERFVGVIVDDPVRGRVLLLAPGVEPVLTLSGAEWMPRFIELLQRKLSRFDDPMLQKMVATSLIGALTSLFTEYLSGRLEATREQFIDYCIEMVKAATGYATPLELGEGEQLAPFAPHDRA